jgi:hypothetical protein
MLVAHSNSMHVLYTIVDDNKTAVVDNIANILFHRTAVVVDRVVASKRWQKPQKK